LLSSAFLFIFHPKTLSLLTRWIHLLTSNRYLYKKRDAIVTNPSGDWLFNHSRKISSTLYILFPFEAFLNKTEKS
jgi:hypothetical protein